MHSYNFIDVALDMRLLGTAFWLLLRSGPLSHPGYICVPRARLVGCVILATCVYLGPEGVLAHGAWSGVDGAAASSESGVLVFSVRCPLPCPLMPNG